MADNRLWDELELLRKKKKDELHSRQKLLDDKMKNKSENSYRDPEPPKLVLSIIGDSKSFVPKPWITSVFQYGLIETAKGAKDSLILYKGSSETVSCIVREAVEDFNRLQSDGDDVFISLVGILPEESMCETSVDLYEEQIHLHDESHHEEQTHLPEENLDEEKIFLHDEIKDTKEKHYGWCKNYWQKKNSDCLLGEIYNVWLGNKRSYADFHASMLKGLSKNKIFFMTFEGTPLEWNVPVLTIVAEGDLDTIEAVNQVLKQDLPILIIKGSGKAADFIAEFIEKDTINISEYIKANTPLLFGISSHDLMQREFDKRRFASATEQRNDLESIMKAIKENNCLITVLDINKETQPKEFTDAVTRAIISGWSRNKSEEDDQMYGNFSNQTKRGLVKSYYQSPYNDQQPAAVSTNVIGGTMRANDHKFMASYKEILTPSSLPLYYYIAYQFIQEMKGAKTVKIENFNILLKEAIVADRDEYVSVLLREEGVEFSNKYFPAIYMETLQSEHKAKTALQNVFKLGTSPVIQKFKELCFPSKEKREQKRNANELSTIEVCIIAGRQICQALLGYHRDASRKKKKRSAYQDLLIWAIFVNRPKLATIFWMKCEQPLLCALFASSLYKRMAAKASDQATKSDMIVQSRIFAERAFDLQSRLYDDDAELAMDLVITKQMVWDITISPMQCAYDHDMLDVLAQTCPQRRLNKIWYSGISSSLGGFWTKGLCCVGCCCGRKCSPAKGLSKFIGAPLTRFLVHYVLFLAALISFSFFLMQMNVYKDIGSIGGFELVFYVHLIGDMLEDYRNLISYMCKSTSTKEKPLRHSKMFIFKKYICNFWNFMDVISYTMAISAACLRFFILTADWQKFCRRFFSLCLPIIGIRFFRVLLMSRKIGPKIIMIKEMLKDLFRFIGILFLCMIGVGVLYHANMYPEHDFIGGPAVGYQRWGIWKIINIPYWQIYGETMLDSFKENVTTPCTMNRTEWENNPDIERCNEYDWVLIVIAAIYMLISNLLLVNLLIAVFSYRFERVQEISEKLWRYLRYEVIMDYRTRIPAPLNLVIRPFYIIYWSCKKLVKKKQSDEKDAFRKRSLDKINALQSMNAIKCVYNI
ncbi:transient receptor potential cation channel subfamily M member 2-like [Mytilus trossulus]|uniref:transient receptor potential cation channel subfamily M member 2-like n=1 Tax=Mytilus trossulus TaxID=6551 RepID=UPI0030064B5B